MEPRYVQLNLFQKLRNEEILRRTPTQKKLDRINAKVDWEKLRPTLEQALYKDLSGCAEKPLFDCILMLKILVLKETFNLDFDDVAFEIWDRATFRWFLNLSKDDDKPDSQTIYKFYQAFTEAGLSVKKLLAR